MEFVFEKLKTGKYDVLRVVREGKVEEIACKPHRRGDSLTYDSERLGANVEMLLLLARRVYRPATFTWMVRGDLLPEADAILGWKATFLERWDKHSERTLEGAPAFLRAFHDKAPMKDLLAAIPVRVVVDPRLGLYGAAAAGAARRARG